MSIDSAVVELVASRPGHACFVSELWAAAGFPVGQLETALADLVEGGKLVIRHNFCADPHFVDADLRVIGLVPPGGDGEARAASACDRLWQRWMADFLASHRCM